MSWQILEEEDHTIPMNYHIVYLVQHEQHNKFFKFPVFTEFFDDLSSSLFIYSCCLLTLPDRSTPVPNQKKLKCSV